MNGMDVTDDMLMALADGELDRDTEAALRQRVAADAGLQHRLAQFEDSAAALRSAFDPGPVPDHLIAAILAVPDAAPTGNVVPLPVVRRWRPELAAAAAVMALAFGLGGYLLGAQDGTSPFNPADFASLATGETAPLPEGGSLRMLGSYETDQGLCRMLAVEGTDTEARQILCRTEGAWQVALRVEAPAQGDFLPASDSFSSTLDSYLDGIGAGPALDPAAEAKALAGG